MGKAVSHTLDTVIDRALTTPTTGLMHSSVDIYMCNTILTERILSKFTKLFIVQKHQTCCDLNLYDIKPRLYVLHSECYVTDFKLQLLTNKLWINRQTHEKTSHLLSDSYWSFLKLAKQNPHICTDIIVWFVMKFDDLFTHSFNLILYY